MPDDVMAGLKAAFSAWLKVQAAAVIRIAERMMGNRSKPEADALIEALNQYYDDAAKNIPRNLQDAVRKVCELAKEKLAQKLPDASAITDDWLEDHVQRYYSDMGERLCRANLNDVTRIIERADGDAVDALKQRLSSWSGRKADQMAANESMFALNNTLIAGYKRAGYQSIWKASNAECPACQALNGVTITTLRPPLHKGCMCTVEMGDRI